MTQNPEKKAGGGRKEEEECYNSALGNTIDPIFFSDSAVTTGFPLLLQPVMLLKTHKAPIRGAEVDGDCSPLDEATKPGGAADEALRGVYLL